MTKNPDRHGLQAVHDDSYYEHYPDLVPNDIIESDVAGGRHTVSDRKAHYDWFPCFYKGWTVKNVT